MTTFDPEAGVLRLSHAALSVLATLAADPTAASLIDHATAPPLAQLRAAGIVGPAGIHPDVRPLATVIGAPRARLDLQVAERGTAWQAPGWADRALVVLAVPAPDVEGAYDLVADAPASAPDLLADLVGLSSALPDPSTGNPVWEAIDAGVVSVDAAVLDALLSGSNGDAAPPGTDVPIALRRVVTALRARWRLTVREPSGARVEVPDATEAVREIHGARVEILDAGGSGLWLVDGPDAIGTLELTVISPAEVRARTAALLQRALG